jgi:hypothetical protein
MGAIGKRSKRALHRAGSENGRKGNGLRREPLFERLCSTKKIHHREAKGERK